MKEVLGTAEFRHFIEAILNAGTTLEESRETLSEALSMIAESLHLGRVLAFMDEPVSVFDLKGKKETHVLYAGSGGYDANPCEKTFEIANSGTVVMSWYPIKGHTWTVEEEHMLNLTMDYIFMVCLRSRMTELLNRSVMIDSVTGAVNMRKVMQVGLSLARERRLSEYVLIFENIKNFRYINRFYGSANGDTILQQYVLRIFHTLHAEELICRLGGDNFVVLIKRTNMDEHLKILSEIKVRLDHGGLEEDVEIPFRCGIYEMQEGDDISDAMMCSSAAVNYARKARGKDFIFFKPSMLEYSLRQKEVSALFPKAIANGEFDAFYQPKVDLKTGELCGCEALVRWRRGGIVIPPGDFVPMLEEEGTICTLDYFILDLICRNINLWRKAGLDPVPVSVNFSKLHLHESNFPERVFSIIDENCIKRENIEIELTEESGYENFEALNDFINTMNAGGVATSIDDFGTGYSSLNIMKDLNPNVIKLDKTFLKNIGDENEKESDLILIKTVVQLVKDLGMEVLAEGIETKVQEQFLREIGCDKAQGYLYDKPLDEINFQKRLLGSRKYTL